MGSNQLFPQNFEGLIFTFKYIFFNVLNLHPCAVKNQLLIEQSTLNRNLERKLCKTTLRFDIKHFFSYIQI